VSFSFTIGGNPTNPLYLIDYGDGSLVANPVSYSNNSPTVNVTYTYSSGGTFNFNLTVYKLIFTLQSNENRYSYEHVINLHDKFKVYNKVSVVSVIRQIKIYNDFAIFSCTPYWRPIDIDGTVENDYSRIDGKYLVFQDYDLRLRLSWFSEFTRLFELLNQNKPCYLIRQNMSRFFCRVDRDKNRFSVHVYFHELVCGENINLSRTSNLLFSCGTLSVKYS
jgi:hypothetical protein